MLRVGGSNTCLYVHHLYETTFFVEVDDMNTEENAMRILREFVPEVEFKTQYQNGWEFEVSEAKAAMLILKAERIQRPAFPLPKPKEN